jgi:hypothetical protein
LYSRFLIPYLNLLCHSSTLVLDKHFSPHELFNISNASVPVFFNFTRNLILLFVPLLNLRHDEKTNFSKTIVTLIWDNQTSWYLHNI